ncbi:MAG TPA: hypothetical protein VFP72_03565 [Kineosporiaceae bacterium]|nr:hypothetical protein [Kineosporiaceae bacterium]
MVAGYGRAVPSTSLPAGLLLAVGCAAIAGCAGPTPDGGAYRRQAQLTAQAVSSIVRTATLAAEAELDGRSLAPFSDTTVSDAETDAGSAQTTFDSRQPPDAAADRLRRQLDAPLSSAVDGLQALRIAQRRGDAGAVRESLRQLEADADTLDRLRRGIP